MNLLAAALALAVLAGLAPAQGKPEAGRARAAEQQDAKQAAKEAEKVAKATAKDPAVAALDAFAAKKVSTKRADWRTSLPEPPVPQFPAGRSYFWHLQTDVGPITVRLRHDIAPRRVASVIYLARLGFYDGLTFHRVIEGFMAQGGCPQGNGTGGPGYALDGEFADDVRHDRAGVVSMANQGKPKTEGSQFFITFAPCPHLDGKHTIFGEVSEGLDAVRAIEARAGEKADEKAAVRIERAWISVAVEPPAKSKAGPAR
ncbi:MAG TPA: peptidylprolyl isomerase [Planctomycetota bacterium]|nr:peptidylprolyl isomerase [Planctomycetota bacterium]